MNPLKSIIAVSPSSTAPSLLTSSAYLSRICPTSCSTSSLVTFTFSFLTFNPLYSPNLTSGSRIKVILNSNSSSLAFSISNLGSTTGINFSLAEIYSLNFEEEGVISKAYNSLNPMHLQYLRQRKPNDTVCIYLTHTGQNKEMLKIAKDIRKYHAKSIVICDHKKREICKYCDETIVIMTTQNTTELSNAVYIASLQYVFNIFTSLKLISNYSYLEETTKAVDKFKMGE